MARFSVRKLRVSARTQVFSGRRGNRISLVTPGIKHHGSARARIQNKLLSKMVKPQ